MYYMVCDKDGLKGLIYPKLKDKNPDFKCKLEVVD